MLAANVGFIRFDYTAVRSHEARRSIGHRQANTVPHEPRSLQGHSEHAPKLIGANTFLAGRYEEDRLQPKVQRNVAVLENGLYANGKGLAAVIALEHAKAGALAVQPANALVATPVLADRAVRPDTGFHECKGRRLVVEVKCRNNRRHDVLPKFG